MTSVNVLVAETDGSSYYRLTEPAKALQAAGYDVEICVLSAEDDTLIREADVFVMNRPIRPAQADMVHYLTSVGKTVIVDIDDDFHHLVPEHTMYGRFDLDPLMAATEMATAVTVSTPALLDTYGHGKGTVVRNMVPSWYLDVVRPEQHEGVWVGWFGTVASHPNDLKAADLGVGKALRKAKADLALLGNPDERFEICAQLGITPGNPLHYSGFCRLHKVPSHISQYDIGIVPLQLCAFNEAKSWLKGLEYAACGVPFVATPTPEYQALREHGAGLLADTRNAWSRHVQELVHDADYRDAVAQRGKQAAAGLTIEANLDQWISAWGLSTAVQRETIEAQDAHDRAFGQLEVAR